MFKAIHESYHLPRAEWPQWFLEHAVPVLYEGPFDEAALRKLHGEMETVSGQALHIREGIVVTPRLPRFAADGSDTDYVCSFVQIGTTPICPLLGQSSAHEDA